MSFFNINGKNCEALTPYFPPTTRSYRYGDGFFESMKWSNGRLLHFDHHMARIHKSAMLLKMNLTEEVKDGIILQWVESVAQQHQIANARVRCTFLRESEGFYTPENSVTTIISELLPIENSNYDWNEKGLTLGAYKEMSKNGNYTSMLKTTSSLIYVMAGIYAKENNLDECIIFNDHGRIAECISSNIFIVAGEFISTPPLSEYCIDGVMRKVVIHLAEAYGYTVLEQPLSEVSLTSADEIFITNASRGIRWIGEYKGKKYKNIVSGVLADKLNPHL
ncbi:MAG: aminotransferase class IV [Bacteroidetes bacterium]|nr:aminotransferase class IV [Bacteroidota bacterium]